VALVVLDFLTLSLVLLCFTLGEAEVVTMALQLLLLEVVVLAVMVEITALRQLLVQLIVAAEAEAVDIVAVTPRQMEAQEL
jgi:hypothetical protein